MKIAKYIGDLLFDYECVVIPGLGGFITEDKSVSVNEFTHKFKPPFRKVYFNARLRANDGMLINHVAQEEQIDYKVAKSRVDNFVFQCKNALEKGKRINFNNIGFIYQDKENNIVFQQDIAVNYNPDSFGLSSVVSPAIRRESDEEKVKKAIKSAIDPETRKKKREDRKPLENIPEKKSSRKEATRRLSSLSKQVIFLVAIFAIMGTAYLIMRRDAMGYYFNRYASHIPFFYSSVNDYLANNINSTPVATLSRNTASLFPSVIENENIQNPVKEEKVEIIAEESIPTQNNADVIINESDVKKVIDNDAFIEETYNEVKENNTAMTVSNNNNFVTTPVKRTLTTMKYYVIAGSFSSEPNAKSLVKELQSKGYNDALIADTNKYGMYRVAFMGTNSKKNAESLLSEIKINNNPKAWILSKK